MPYAAPMAVSPEQQRAIDDLISQVHVDNVLQVAAAFRRHADDIEHLLYTHGADLRLGRCGGDPISAYAQEAFQAKIDQVIAVHWAHAAELRAAGDALRASAHGYGYTDADLDSAFRDLTGTP